ncbi:MAG: hypothetical protein EZS28_008080 [Streblomastix strix]|uniref:Uncharacterized protein n=1 Tax=Streblomastix strix TaxID=222440 RepID=A0A5J4WP40_9EUKA|nr:MAG: hypothetical protein EZS28_008080 [Streblomastix strix]
MQKVLDQNSKGGITEHKKRKQGQKTKEEYKLRPPKEHKRSNSEDNDITVYEPTDEEIYKQQKLNQQQAQFHKTSKAIDAMIFNMENQAIQQSRIANMLYKQRDPAFTDSYNPNAVINEPANDLASRTIPWHMLQLQNQMLSGSSSKGVPQIGFQTDLQSRTSTQDPDVQQTDYDAGGQQNENISQQQQEAFQQAKLWAAQLIQDNNETKKNINNLEYKSEATDLGQPAINAAHTNNPYPRKNTGYYMNVGGIPSLMWKKEVYTKEAKINRQKSEKELYQNKPINQIHC